MWRHRFCGRGSCAASRFVSPATCSRARARPIYHHYGAAMWCAWYFILCLVPASRQISIKEFTVPHAVQAGEDAELQCRYDLNPGESDKGLYVKWWWTPLNATSDQMHQIYQRISGLEPVTIHSTINLELLENDGIRLVKVTPADSGIYECEVSNIDEVREHQELIVYSMGTGPQLNISMALDGPEENEETKNDDEEYVIVTCEANDVAPYPDLSITVAGNIANLSETVNGPIEGLYDIFANATVSKNLAEGAEIRCELFFKNDNISHPAYVDIETFNTSGAEVSTTEVPENITASDVVSDNLQNRNGGKCHSISRSLIFGQLVPALFYTFSLKLYI
ncbi:unnamed protein product [Parnassius apollo]|uniref:(apollo) hypothetical protein n=1 Tax=Parnassius apollo TaxID=110799 RepID=A0A8S3WPY5_PARAO|nr:unnamed protein product [Parnassius apollo]